MVTVPELWLPILVSAVLVFIVSSLIHMFLGYHKNDYERVPQEDAVTAALRPLNIPPGDYVVPWAGSPEVMKSPEYQEKVSKGPVIFMTVLENRLPGMGKQLALWFLYAVVVSVFAGYIASRAVGEGGVYLDVFRFAGTVAFVGYGLALWQQSIWYRRKWSTTLKSNFDALIYAVLTAGTFGWLWPWT